MTEVDLYMSKLDHPRKDEIETLRGLIRSVDNRIMEGIKWNAPSFFIEEHVATLKLRPGATVQVVLHTGAKKKAEVPDMKDAIDDPVGMLRWAANDRCVVTFSDADEIAARSEAFRSILKEWIDILT